MAPCLLVFLAEGFPNRVADLKRGIQPAKGVMFQKGSTYKLKSLNIKIRTNSEKKYQIPTTKHEPIDPHRASTSTCRGFILLWWFPFFITSNDQTVSSFSGVASLKLFLHWLRKVSNICWLHLMHVNSSWPSFFLKEDYWIHFCLPEVFAVKQHSKETWNSLVKWPSRPHHSGSPLCCTKRSPFLTTVPTAQHGLCFCGVTFHIVGLCLRCTGG